MKFLFSIFLLNLFISGFCQNNQIAFYSLDKAFETPKVVKKLDLSNKKINKLPDSINQFINLEILILSSNNIEVLPKVIGDFSKLKILDLSDNQIKELPEEITRLSHLKEIDLSGNVSLNYADAFAKLSSLKKLGSLTIRNAPSIPCNIDTLQQIQKLYLSNDVISDKQCSLLKLKKLKKLIINNCIIDDYNGFISKLKYLKKLEYLSISSNDITELPASLCELSSLKHIELKMLKLKYLPTNFSDLSKLKTLVLSNSSVINIDTLFTTIENLERLNYLNLNSCNLSYIPNSISNVAAIRNLNLSGNNIKTLPSNTKKLSKLTYLDLRGNPIDVENYNKIKKQLPNCTIVSDIGLEKSGIKPPLKFNIVEMQTYKANSERESVLMTNSGSKINIPVHAFVDEKGQVVSGEVRIEYKEYNNVVDVFLSGIPMNYQKDGVDYFFNSGGMFTFNAYKNDSILYANPNSPVTINLISYNDDKRMNLYHYDDIQQGWVEIETGNSIVESAFIVKPLPPRKPNITDTVLIKPIKEELVAPRKPIFNYSIYKARLYVTFNNDNKSFSIVLPNNPPGKKYPKYQYKAFVDVEYLKDYNWVCDTESITEYQKFKKRIEEKKNIDDIKISSKSSENSFTLSIILDKDSLCISAKPFNYGHPSQHFSLSTYMKYYNKRNTHWEKVDYTYNVILEQYNTAIESYNKEMLLYEKALDSNDLKYNLALDKYVNDSIEMSVAFKDKAQAYEIQLSDYNLRMKEWKEVEICSNFSPTKKNNRIVREVILSGFGTWNVDYIDFDPERTILAKFEDTYKKPLEPKFVYVLNDSKSSVSTFIGNQEIRYNSKSTIALFVLFEDMVYGYVNPKDFKKYTRPLFPSKILNTSIQELNNVSLENVRKLIANNKK